MARKVDDNFEPSTSSLQQISQPSSLSFTGHLPELPRSSVVDVEELRLLICDGLVTSDVFEQALVHASDLGVPVDGYLVQTGLMDETAYFQRLARAIGIDYIGIDKALAVRPGWEERAFVTTSSFASQVFNSENGVVIAPWGLGVSALKAYIEQVQNILIDQSSAESALHVTLTSRLVATQAFKHFYKDQLIANARDGLANLSEIECAKGGLSWWQKLGLIAGLAGLVYGFMHAPSAMILGLSLFFSIFFFLLISLRVGTCLLQAKSALGLPTNQDFSLLADRDLPVYTILVPLFKEAHMVPQIVQALRALDYPEVKLDIKLLLEEGDLPTIAAALDMKLPAFFDVLIVPSCQPQTKPKALNYGLLFAKGEYVVIFDAEDLPDPSQLKQALVLFAQNNEHLACVQAKLNFYNGRQNWLTKQFCVEYCSLFDGVLPSLGAFGFPLPLGGTSNHFRADVLVGVGGWDPFNVTEDADLGMRLYRRGFYARVLPSTTHEEACSGLKNWFMQRTRWLKGWMQTYMVHMRTPFKLLRELGLWKFIGFQAIIGGPIFSCLAHPIFLAILFWQMPFAELPNNFWVLGLWVLSLFNLSIGYLATMWLGVIGLRLRNLSGFLFSILTIPLYWILISLAAYRALFQFIYAPFHWEKTHHTGQQAHQK